MNGKAQLNFPDSLNKKSLRRLVIGESIIYAGGMTGLYFLWYKDQSSSKFHFFNDVNQWLQMDKFGHAQTAYFLSDASFCMYKSVGLADNKALLISSAQSFLFQSSLEVFDGFSNGWGFSWSDMLANVSGNGLFLAQQLAWKEQRIRLKFSSHLTANAHYRPEVLGSNYTERLMKDYNGQTYWLSVTPASFSKRSEKRMDYLAIAFGCSAQGMLGGDSNPEFNAQGKSLPQLPRYRQYYLSFDIDFSKLKSKRKWVNYMFRLINFVKIPFPAIEFSQEGMRFRALYF